MSATSTDPAPHAGRASDQRRPDREDTVTEAEAEDLWRSGDRWSALAMLYRDGADPGWIANTFPAGLDVNAMVVGDLVDALVDFYEL